MKTLLCTLALVVTPLFAGWSAEAEETVEVGDSRERVLEVLGPPSGQGRFDSYLLMSYPRGSVMLESNRVTEVELIDLATWEVQQAERKQLAAQRARQAHADLQELLSDPIFLGSPLENRMRHWQGLRDRYPELALPNAYRRDAEDWVRWQRNQKREEARLAELERRTVAAEWAARDAQREAEQARREAELNRPRNDWGTTIYHPPVVYGTGGTYYYNKRDRHRSHDHTSRGHGSSSGDQAKEEEPNSSGAVGVRHRSFTQGLPTAGN